MPIHEKHTTKEAPQEHEDRHQPTSTAPDDPSNSSKSSKQPRRLDYSTHISDIHGATTVKYNHVFMLTNSSGDVLPQDHGYGLYFRDMCYLDRMEFRLQGQLGVSLLSDGSAGARAVFELTNPHLQLDGGELPKERLSIRRAYSLGEEITQRFEIHNLSQDALEIDLSLHFASSFEDMFVVRGRQPGKRGHLRQPSVKQGAVTLEYDGADGRTRTTTLTFSPAPDELDGSHAVYHLKLAARQRSDFTVSLELRDRDIRAGQPPDRHSTHTHQSGAHRHDAFASELAKTPTIETSNPIFDRALSRSLADIRMLATALDGDVYVAAGIPWYVALFGRDSCITAFETLAFNPALARSTLLTLARFQGEKDDAFQDEEPGKILHELRVGEMANLHEVPMIPYYGTVDATPWFLMLLAEYVRWTGDLALFRQLRSNVDRALAWIGANESDPHDLPGFISYGSRSERGLLNQGWKDSDNGIVNADGSICRPPIALVEVQGYAYHARRGVAHLLRLTGEADKANEIEKQADDLKERFNERYWRRDAGYYAFCLQRDFESSFAVASNPGQTLFTGVVEDGRAKSVADRLLQGDMFCGWGIRTLSANEKAYNPLDYQTGSVWPHDNALIALGLRRRGFLDQAERVFTGIFQAAQHFSEYRLPEVFDGFGQDQYPRPVHYPVACSPQAWAAGALPLLLQTALGLEPEATDHKLHIRNPRLPAWLASLTVRDLRIGDASVDLKYRREGDVTRVEVARRQGAIDVDVQT
jgi:glycogen debranching enzyme